MSLIRASRASVLLSRVALQALVPSARLATLPLLALTLAAPAAHAQVVYNNGNPNNTGAIASDLSVSQFSADTFTFASTTTFNTVTWFGVYAFSNTPTFPDNFTISFYDTTGGTPNALARPGETFTIGNSATRTPTGANIQGFDVYQYSSAIPALTLGAGTYGIGIVNDTAADTDDDWLWTVSNQTGTLYYRNSPTQNFIANPVGDLAFNLSNTAVAAAAPEPGTIALLLSAGVPAAGLVRRRAKNRA